MILSEHHVISGTAPLEAVEAAAEKEAEQKQQSQNGQDEQEDS